MSGVFVFQHGLDGLAVQQSARGTGGGIEFNTQQCQIIEILKNIKQGCPKSCPHRRSPTRVSMKFRTCRYVAHSQSKPNQTLLDFSNEYS